MSYHPVGFTEPKKKVAFAQSLAVPITSVKVLLIRGTKEVESCKWLDFSSLLSFKLLFSTNEI